MSTKLGGHNRERRQRCRKVIHESTYQAGSVLQQVQQIQKGLDSHRDRLRMLRGLSKSR
jgi:hypothetical protein